jgi:hypothetical protein
MTGCDGGERRDDENFAEDTARESRLFGCEVALESIGGASLRCQRRQDFATSGRILVARTLARFQSGKRKGAVSGAFHSGRYWARTSDPQLVELVLNPRFAGAFFAVGKDLGKSHNGDSGFERLQTDKSLSEQPSPQAVSESGQSRAIV